MGYFSLLCLSSSSRELNSRPLDKSHLNGLSNDIAIVSLYCIYYFDIKITEFLDIFMADSTVTVTAATYG